MASVSGFSFTANVNALGATVDQEKFESVCEELSRRQHMVRRAGWHRSSDGTIFQCYEFTHALYWEMPPRYRATAISRLKCIPSRPSIFPNGDLCTIAKTPGFIPTSQT